MLLPRERSTVLVLAGAKQQPSSILGPLPPSPRQVPYRNQGGFHLIGSGRDKIEKPEQLGAAAAAFAAHDLDGLVRQ